ncbi:MAG: Amino acid transporter rane protein 2, family [Marmoricola sp.]|jgi:glutamate transport system permease protein|nr:Amino acid transporter rane protein 2, family [Marmoricola sp.]
MRSSVLFDAPGPKTRLRHRVYSVVAVIALIALVALLVMRLDEKGQLAYRLWEPFITPVYIQALLEGLLNTVKMAATSVVFAVIFGLVMGTAKMSERAWIRWPAWLVVEFFRAVPVLLLMVFFFLAYGIGSDGIGPYWCVVAALTLYNGSVLAEVFRAGINAVPPGQAEAAYAVGMRKSQVMNLILLPQAVKIMLPSIISQCVVTLKDTSLGFYIAAPGLTAVAKSIYTEFQNQVQTAIVVAGIYIVVNLVLTAIATYIQKRYVGERTLDVAAEVA